MVILEVNKALKKMKNEFDFWNKGKCLEVYMKVKSKQKAATSSSANELGPVLSGRGKEIHIALSKNSQI